MKNIKSIRQYIWMGILLCTSAFLVAAPLGSDGDAYTWSILNDQLAISPGSIITDAALTIHNVSLNSATGNETLYLHLLDNPDVDVKNYADGQPENYFEGYGVFLKQINESDLLAGPSDVTINLEQINDDSSPVWDVFEQPFIITLPDTSQVPFSSALLSLLDYAGTGSSFGFGLDCDGLTFDGLSFELTIQSMTGVVHETMLSFYYGNANSPILQPIPDQYIDAGQELIFTVTATDADNDTLSYSASNLPEGAVFANQTFTWTPSNQQAGIHQVEFMVSDSGEIIKQAVNITVSPVASEWTLLTYDDFESGWGNYTDGGYDCYLYTRSKYAPQGHKAASIRDGSGDASSFVLTNGIDVTSLSYSEINITFSYIPISMDNSSEGFRLDYWDGTEWLTLRSWRQHLDFENNLIYSETVEISRSNTAFPANMKIRFVCEASNNIDLIMIDEINIFAK